MGKTSIEWATDVWNPVTGCTKVSEGCRNCYAERITERFHGKGSFDKIILHPNRLEIPLHWKKPRRIFVNSMSDLFHEDIDEKFIAKIFGIMDYCKQHRFLVLTKRPDRMRKLLNDEDFQFHIGWFQSMVERELKLPTMEIGPYPFKNVWLGISCEDQKTADERIPILLQIPAAVRWISAEPLLGPINLQIGSVADEHSSILDSYHGGLDDFEGFPGGEPAYHLATNAAYKAAVDRASNGINWVVVGGESGPQKRPIDLAWARSIRDQCRKAGVSFFMKQIDKVQPIPEDLMIREYPA